jgi:hypothetical protein
VATAASAFSFGLTTHARCRRHRPYQRKHADGEVFSVSSALQGLSAERVAKWKRKTTTRDTGFAPAARLGISDPSGGKGQLQILQITGGEFDAKCPMVLPHVLLPGRLRYGYYAALAHQPCERYL